jgi:plasmid maintenance system antidote protein VapI
MADLARLKDAVSASGLKKGFIAQKMGVSSHTLRNKLTGSTDFTADEIVVMSRLLSLSDDQTRKIFLA